VQVLISNGQRDSSAPASVFSTALSLMYAGLYNMLFFEEHLVKGSRFLVQKKLPKRRFGVGIKFFWQES
jgi:hypothetical protein